VRSSLWYVPAEQPVHTVAALVEEYRPGRQGAHALAPVPDLPAWQIVQSVKPAFWALPATQAVHAEAPVVPTTAPAAQEAQAAAPVAAANLPAEQLVQLETSAAE